MGGNFQMAHPERTIGIICGALIIVVVIVMGTLFFVFTRDKEVSEDPVEPTEVTPTTVPEEEVVDLNGMTRSEFVTYFNRFDNYEIVEEVTQLYDRPPFEVDTSSIFSYEDQQNIYESKALDFQADTYVENFLHDNRHLEIDDVRDNIHRVGDSETYQVYQYEEDSGEAGYYIHWRFFIGQWKDTEEDKYDFVAAREDEYFDSSVKSSIPGGYY